MIGILSLQGCVSFHTKHFETLGVATRLVRTKEDLQNIKALVLPGGESTTMLKLLHRFEMWDALKKKAEEIPFWGVCAGAILMAKCVHNPEQESLGIIDLEVRRNAYGRQLESFSGSVSLADPLENPLESRIEDAIFIRAPKFSEWGKSLLVLGKTKGEAVFLSDNRHMVTAFHPELGNSHWCHKYFLKKIS